MTRTSIFLFHPNLDQSTVNLRLAQAAEGQEGVQIRDLYGLYPDFEIDVNAEQDILEASDRIVLQFPMYWYSCPPLLKKWEDDILTYGWAYGTNGDALHGKELLIAVSPGAPAAHYTRISAGRRSMTDLLLGRRPGRDESVSGYRVTDLLRPFQATSNLIGTRFVTPFVTAGAMSIGDAELAARAEDYAAYLTATVLPALGDHE